MKMPFELFMSRLSETNVDLSFFTDFKKVSGNVSTIEMHLNCLNYLLGKENLDSEIIKLYQQNPKCFSVLGILIATRKAQKKKTINSEGECVLVESYFENAESAIEFFKETGLKSVFQNQKINNLVDYVFGVEVGLDTHARKNRGGKYMERAVANLLRENEIPFKEQVTTTSINGINWEGGDVKQFDFVIETSTCTYLIETNYYSSAGSKLNETARSYSNVSSIIDGHEGFEFVWITDGLGWESAKNKLEDSYNKIDRLYNLSTVLDFIAELKTSA